MPTKLGQNFLQDTNVVKKIIASSEITSADLVIEIGPGQGILTQELIKSTGQVIAIELDKNLVDLLNKKFSGVKNLKIINEDILKVNLKEIAKSYKVIANIPYYITAPIIRFFLENEIPPQEMILMVQKEVAERIVAKPGKMSLLAVSVQYYAEPKILFPVSRNCFKPVPEVDSAVIKISKIKNQNEKLRKEFFKIVKAGFSAKRKTLLNNLANGFHLDKKIVAEKLNAIGILPTARAQELSIEDWKKLTILFS